MLWQITLNNYSNAMIDKITLNISMMIQILQEEQYTQERRLGGI